MIAHRGGAAAAPENTLPAFRRSLALGFDQVELDVQLSRDGVPILFHDGDLGEKVGRTGPVADYTAAELTTFEIGSWFVRRHPGASKSHAGTRLIELSTLFETFGARLYYHVEIKGDDPRAPMRVLEQIDAFGLRARVTVTSFSRRQLEAFRRLAPDVPICWILERSRSLEGARERLERQRDAIGRAAEAGFEQVALPAAELGSEIVAQAHARGLGIRAWGIHSALDEERAIASGCDGATTDWPGRLRERLEDSPPTRAGGP